MAKRSYSDETKAAVSKRPDESLTPEKGEEAEAPAGTGFYDWSPVFLEELTKIPNISKAARKAGITRPKAYYHRERNEAFRHAWDEAIEIGVDRLEQEMWRRAVRGTKKPVTYQGEITAWYREYSDTLAIFLAKAHRPEKFRERYELTGAGGGDINIKVTVSDD